MERNGNSRGKEEGKTYALYSETCNVGKNIISSKKRVTWRIAVDDKDEHDITLIHSLASGKKVLRLNGSQIHKSQTLNFGDWDYVFNLKGGHMVHIMIKPSADLNDLYDLIVDNVSFRRLPRKDSYDSYSQSSKSSASRGDSYRIDYGDSPPAPLTKYERESSYGESQSSTASWTCDVCTLINEKHQAPVCEACGSPRPRQTHHHSPRSKSLPVQDISHLRKERVEPPAETTRQANHTDFFHEETAFDPFSTQAGTKQAFDPFDTHHSPNPFASPPVTESVSFQSTPAVNKNPFAEQPKKVEDISSSLAGLDFSAPVPTPVAPEPVRTNNVEKVEDEQSQKEGDLWSSKMVNLDLTGKADAEKKGIKKSNAGPSLEQARLMDARKAKSISMPPSPMMVIPPAPVQLGHPVNPAMISPMMSVNQNGLYHNGVGFPAMGSPQVGFNSMQAAQPLNPNMGVFNTTIGSGQQFPGGFTTNPGPRLVKTGSFAPVNNDPFATLR